ncbi:hypothetical protein, partial [Neglectibacter sp. X4]|uniref:hypothetical protein n=1 Tax=Neglectibacter sp. X4 TaxID=2305472 RepID=UPI001A9AFA19
VAAPKHKKSPEFQGIPGQVCGRGRRIRTLGTRFWRATVQILDSFRCLYLVPLYTEKRLKVWISGTSRPQNLLTKANLLHVCWKT